jgi:hypothetical protein
LGGARGRACLREAVSVDPDHWIRGGRLGSSVQGFMARWLTLFHSWRRSHRRWGKQLSRGVGSPVLAATGEEGPTNSLAGLRSRERDWRRENGGGSVADGSGNSGEQSRPLGGGIGCAKARTSSGEVKGMLWTKARARNRVELTGHRMGSVNQRGRTPARTI